MKTIFFVGFCIVFIEAIYSRVHFNHELDEDWKIYKSLFDKRYEHHEEIARKLVWEKNVKHIEQHNLDYDLGKHNYTLGINEFSDLTEEEFTNTFLDAELIESDVSSNLHRKFSSQKGGMDIPKEIDWRKKGYVTDVGYQRNCRCGYAFASTGALEGQQYKISNILVPLSKQQIVDCSSSYGNRGCFGGWLSTTYAYLADKGSVYEQYYQFTGRNGSCSYDPADLSNPPSKGFEYVSNGDENDLAIALVTKGPVAVMIDASQPDFRSYRGGIYDNPSCSTISVNHGVLVVGYGVEGDKKYWIIKNSMGIQWGDSGYMKMKRGTKNMCGIASWGSVPTM